MPNYGIIGSLLNTTDHLASSLSQGLLEADRRKYDALENRKKLGLEAAEKGIIEDESGNWVKGPQALHQDEHKAAEHELGLIRQGLQALGPEAEGTVEGQQLIQRATGLMGKIGLLSQQAQAPITAPTPAPDVAPAAVPVNTNRQQLAQTMAAPRGGGLVQPKGALTPLPGYVSKEDRAIQKATKQAVAIEQAKTDLENKPDVKLNKMSGDNRKRLDLVVDAISNLNRYDTAFDSGERRRLINPDTPIAGYALSSNPIDEATSFITESIGRLNSGGAINNDENKKFLKMVPTARDSDEAAKRKLTNLRAEFENKLTGLGFKPEQLDALGFKGVSKQAPAPADVKIIDGKKYKKVKGGWEAQ